MATAARNAPAWNPADFFAHAADSCATAIHSGFEAQSRAMDAWTRTFGAQSPAMTALAGFDAQSRRFFSEAAEMSTKNVAELAALSTESAKMTTAIFADAMATFFGPEAPASVEEVFENGQRIARESVEVTRVLADKSAKVAARQFETFQAAATRAAQPVAARKGAKDSR